MKVKLKPLFCADPTGLFAELGDLFFPYIDNKAVDCFQAVPGSLLLFSLVFERALTNIIELYIPTTNSEEPRSSEFRIPPYSKIALPINVHKPPPN